MIRFRHNVSAASGGTPNDFVSVWKFRVVVTCPPGETVNVTPVRESSLKDSYVFGPGDSGWVTFDQKHTAIRVAKGTGSSTATVDVWWADEKTDEVHAAGAYTGSPVGSVLYDSGSVAAGAAIDSGVLDLSSVAELEVIVDNTAGTVLRDLSLLSYLANGTTLIDTHVLRRCAFGAAPTGATHAPGRIRGYVGRGPPGGTTGTHVLFDQTGADNAQIATGPIIVEDSDFVMVSMLVTGGGTATLGTSLVFDNGATVGVGTTAAVAGAFAGIGPGVSGMTPNAQFSNIGTRRVQFLTGLPGVGSTTALRVIGRGRVPGTFAQQMILPLRAAIQLAAGGAGAARLTVIAR